MTRTNGLVVSLSPSGGRLKAYLHTMLSGVGLTPKRLSSRTNPKHWGPCNPELVLA